MAEQNVNAEDKDRRMVVSRIMVETIRRNRIRLTELFGGVVDNQQFLEHVVDLAVDVIRFAEQPVSAEGVELLDDLQPLAPSGK
ncbi:hypothetical protein GCK72_025208 [Caenorhabditis remanei]|uniref:Uncharacterized protein n=1 Tax=Caenorhabditis remanei TaxID=31234 RepID=A0A6A5G1V1_CAERE|nr:hypothetical protein GCK72_025208 [Caenorhabditis remanei]KAF1748741.1 hypothetical protein GCK72_025208 [Caenorhabditis remanei]